MGQAASTSPSLMGFPHLPPCGWKRTTDCLDCRPLNHSWVSDAERQAQGVTVEQDLQSFAQALLAGGEGLQSEFKQVLPWNNDGQANKQLSDAR